MTTLPRDTDWPASMEGVVPFEKLEFAVRGKRLVSNRLARSNRGIAATIGVLTFLLLAVMSTGFLVDVMGVEVESDSLEAMGVVGVAGFGLAASCLGFGIIGPRLPGRHYAASREGLVESRRGGYVVWTWREFEKVEVDEDGTVSLVTKPKVVGKSRRGKPSTVTRTVELVEVPEAEAIAARCRDLIKAA